MAVGAIREVERAGTGNTGQRMLVLPVFTVPEMTNEKLDEEPRSGWQLGFGRKGNVLTMDWFLFLQ